ncbi:response regulator [Phenylobacterium sp. LH3H17]|uniref:response regulator n=1 Tax=Phenylobacterium sp. LH3H17 TaxID=2903901 RepID=UPI0020C9597E|nr:response regulator [Phenylobacterium sp. LH3H17]UTP40361.1 response regulator [Phenylobacterium sp. LH3H17]
MIEAVANLSIEPLPGERRPTTRILIVDDDERNAFAASQALESLGQELIVARSGEEALRFLLTEDFAVILLDLHMPGMDGYETARMIRLRRRNREVPIVFLTAVFRDEAHIFKAYSAGAVDVVFKPVDPFILRSKVQVLVDLHLKTLELARQSEQRRLLLEENAKVHAEKLAAERALRLSQERQEQILRALPVVFHSRTAEAPYAATFVSDSVLGLTGFPPSRFVDEPDFATGRIHPDDRAAVEAAQAEARTKGVYSCEYRWLCADGVYRSLLDQGVLAPAEEGQPPTVFGTLLDNTDRRRLEEDLAQARKMEAVGQLTGGVAHDFNNLLTVILGNVDRLQRRVDGDEKLGRYAEAIRFATDRGSALTRQLLAFSRRQHLNPRTIELNALVTEFMPLLRQAVGDGVTVVADLAKTDLHVLLDAAQFETALLNLAVNARDAMASAGTVSIETLVQGEEVVIRVADTGSGMEPDIAARIFEPFFTTKEVGLGSGLGLSQVYGFVRQSGGQVSVESAPGHGARFEIRLPRSSVAACPPVVKAATPVVVGGTERILVVEDDPHVLALTEESLRTLGYAVITADSANAALGILQQKVKLDLLFSDVVMPGGMTGFQLAQRARQLRPQLKVLLTSGYVGDAAKAWGDSFPLLDKPYEAPALAARLRAILDSDAPALANS